LLSRISRFENGMVEIIPVYETGKLSIASQGSADRIGNE
jgi:hypothetical protein